MLFFSMTFCFFNKLFFNPFGSAFIDDPVYIAETGWHAFYFGVIARMLIPFSMQEIGFKKTYTYLLTTQSIVVFTFPLIVRIKILYRIWVIIGVMCGDSTLSLMGPFCGGVYGHIMQVPALAI